MCRWLIYQSEQANSPPGNNRLWWFAKPIADRPWAATELLATGLKDVTVLRGGTDEWHRQGLSLE